MFYDYYSAYVVTYRLSMLSYKFLEYVEMTLWTKYKDEVQ
jgi:hypothetical protein